MICLPALPALPARALATAPAAGAWVPGGRGVGPRRVPAPGFRGLGRAASTGIGMQRLVVLRMRVCVCFGDRCFPVFLGQGFWVLVGLRGDAREGLFYGLRGVRGFEHRGTFSVDWLFSCFGCLVVRCVHMHPYLVGCSFCRFAFLCGAWSRAALPACSTLSL